MTQILKKSRKFWFKPTSSSVTRTLLLVLLPLTILPVLVMGGSAYLRARDLLRDQVASQLDSIAHVEGNFIDDWVRRKQIRLSLATLRPQLRENLEEFLGAMSSGAGINENHRVSVLKILRTFTQLDGNPSFNEFLVVHNDGTILFSSRPSWEGLNISATPYFPRLAGQELSLAYYSPSPFYEDELVAFTSEAFFDSEGQVAATIIGVTESFNILKLLDNIPLAHSDARAYMISEEGIFLGLDRFGSELVALTPDPEQRDILLPLRAEYIHHGEADQQHAMVDIPSFDRELVTASYTWVPSLNIGIVVEVPQRVTFSQLGSLRTFTLLLLTGIVVFFGLVTWFGSRRLTQPLLQVAHTIKYFSEGDWSQRVALNRDDEIGLLADTFDKMADELTGLYQSLEEQVEARSRQIRTAAEMVQYATSATELDVMLIRTVNLIVEQFGYYHASIFLLDSTLQHAELREATGPIGETLKAENYRLAVGSQSIIGWVTANNQARIASDVGEDTLHSKHELLPDTRSEVGIPIAVGGRVLGALDVQSTNPHAFDLESIAALQILANQVAAAIRNIGLLESTQVDLQEMSMLYRAGRDITWAENDERILATVGETLRKSPYPNALYRAEPGGFRLLAAKNPYQSSAKIEPFLPVDPKSITFYKNLALPLWIFDPASRAHISMEFRHLTQQLQWQSVAYLPIEIAGELTALIVLGSREEGAFNEVNLQPYTGLVELTSVALEKVSVREAIQKRLAELQTLSSVSQIIATETDFSELYGLIHSQIRNIMGEVGFLIAIYDEQTRRIEVPFAYEGNEILHVESVPLGDGPTSSVIRTRQPLMLLEGLENRADELGHRLLDKPAKSWLGVPLIVADQLIGVMSIHDLARERRFNEDDMRLMNTLAAQVAIVIRNARLLEETQSQAVQLEIAAEIARDVSQTLNLDVLLRRAIDLIRDRFGYYHASVFTLDRDGENAVVRESSGDVGRQMKTTGHKLAVGSKSIIGYVTSRRVPLVVNDVSNDPNHRPHPLLPETQAEAGIPIRIGERLLGALDVQSKTRYAFTQDQVKVMQILADQLAVAIINAELFQETQDHLAQHRLLHHVTSASASSTTLEEALISTVQGLRATLDGDQVSIYLTENEGQTLDLKASAGKPLENQDEAPVVVGQGLVGWVAAQRQPIRIDDFLTDSRFSMDGTDTRSSLALPLMYRKELLGVLQVESPLESAYNENDQEMLGTLCGTLAAIIANTRLIERQRLLFEVTSKIRRSISVQNILETTITELSQVVGAKRASIRVGGDPAGPGLKANGGQSGEQTQADGRSIEGGEEGVL